MEDLVEVDDAASGPNKNIMVVRVRARNSAELEEVEAALLAYDQTLDGRLPLPFRAENEIEPLGEYALKTLQELGITVNEYMELVS